MLKSDFEQRAKLIEFARALGQEPDPELVKDVENYLAFQQELRENVRQSVISDLSQAIRFTTKQLESNQPEFPQQPSLEDLQSFLAETITEEKHDLDTQTPPEIPATAAADTSTVAEQTLADLVAQSITASVKKDSFQQPTPVLAQPDITSLTRKIQQLEGWVSKISLLGPGGGASDTSNFTTYTTAVTGNSYTIARKDYYVGVNHDGEVTITLPSGYVEPGRGLIIKDESSNCSLNPITITGNVDNDGYGFVLQIDNGSVQLLYHNGWRII